MFPSGFARAVADIERRSIALATELNPAAVPLADAGHLYDQLDRAARALVAAKTLLAPRVAESRDWQRRGHRSAEEGLAARGGTSLAAAKSAVATGKAVADNSKLRSAMTQGDISPDQATVIADATRVNPDATGKLLDAAKTSNLNQLRAEAGRVKAAADRDPDATYRRLHRARRLSRFTHSDGSRHLHLQGPIDLVSVIEAELDRCLSHHIRTLPAGKPLEGRDTMAFDAAIAMARRSIRADHHPPTGDTTRGTTRTGDPDRDTRPGARARTTPDVGSDPTDTNQAEPNDAAGSQAQQKQRRERQRRAQPAPEHLALLRIDVEALWRGHIEGDEICEITGLGPFPITAARRLLGDAVIKLIITKGDAVAHVTSLTRGPNQAMRYALLWASPECTATGCGGTVLEHDHAHGAEYKHTHHTRLDELDRLCHAHHALHTYRGWALVNGTGKRPMVAPTDPRHPNNTGPAATPPTMSDPDPPDRRPDPTSPTLPGIAA